MLRILYYLCTKSGKISAKKGGGLTLRHGRTLRILRYKYLVYKSHPPIFSAYNLVLKLTYILATMVHTLSHTP